MAERMASKASPAPSAAAGPGLRRSAVRELQLGGGGPVETSLLVGAANDPAERAANAAADTAGAGPAPEMGAGGRAGRLTAPMDRALRGQVGRGDPMPSAVAAGVAMTGAPLGQVRIHRDGASERLADDLGARAFTFGTDIFFGSGSWAPDTSTGRQLLLHELSHTLESAGEPRVIRRQGKPGSKTKIRRKVKLVSVDAFRNSGHMDFNFNDGTSLATRAIINTHPLPGTYDFTYDGKSYTTDQDMGNEPSPEGLVVLRGDPNDFADIELVHAVGDTIRLRVLTDGKGGKGVGTGGTLPTTPTQQPPTQKPPAGGTAGKTDSPAKTPAQADGAGKGDAPGKGASPGKGTPAGTGSVPRAPTTTPGTASVDLAAKGKSDSAQLSRIRALPPDILAILVGVNGPDLEPGDYDQLIAIGEKLKRLTPDERQLYKLVATSMSADLAKVEQSLDVFLATKDEIKRQIDAKKTGSPKEPTIEEKVKKTWDGFDKAKFAAMTPDEKEDYARQIADQQTVIQLRHMVSHPGETAVGMVEGVVRPDKVAGAIAEDVKEMADGSRNGFARSAAAAGILGKSSGWVAAVAGILYVALLFVPGVNVGVLAATALAAGAVALTAAVVESELRIQSAKRESDPARFQSDVDKAAAAQANALVQAAMLAVHLAAKLIAKIPLGERYQNVGTAARSARSSLLRVTRIGPAFDAIRTGLNTRLRAAVVGLREALNTEKAAVAKTSAQVQGMTGKELLNKVAAGDAVLSEATGLDRATATAALEAAKQVGSESIPDAIRRDVLKGLQDAPARADQQVTAFTADVERAAQAVDAASTPAELQTAIDRLDARVNPQAVIADEQANTRAYVAGRVKAELEAGAAKSASAKPATPPKPPESPAGKAPAKPSPTEQPKAAEPPKAPDAPKTAEPPKTTDSPRTAEPPKTTDTSKATETPKATEPLKPVKPVEDPLQAMERSLAEEEAVLRAQEKATGKPAQPTPQQPAGPDPVIAAKARVAAAEADLAQLAKEKAALRAERDAQAANVEREAKEKPRIPQEYEKGTDPADPVATKNMSPAAKDSLKRYGEARANLDQLARDIADVNKKIATAEQAKSVAQVDVDPRTHRAPLPCFSPDTLVWTTAGRRRIDSVTAGVRVLTFDVHTDSMKPCTVREALKNQTMHFYAVRIGPDVVQVTGGHRFWAPVEGRWVAANKIAVGLVLQTPSGPSAPVESVELRECDRTDSWNLAIDGIPDYFVGPGLLAHNGSGFETGLGGNKIIYRAVNKKFPGKVYIGQTVDLDIRFRAHVRLALKKLANPAGLTAKDLEFYEFMSEIEPLEPLVKGLNNDQADFLEQHNLKLERDELGKRTVNRREQIRGEQHLQEVTDRIAADPAVKAAGFCSK